MTRGKGGDKIYLAFSEYVKIGAMFITLLAMQVTIAVNQAGDKAEIRTHTETLEGVTKRLNDLYHDQAKFNQCVENGFAKEFGKSVWFYQFEYEYRGKKFQPKIN